MEALYIILAVAFYFLPTIVGNRKRNANAIFTLNLLLGWTVIGWIVALVWATTAEPPALVAAKPGALPPAPENALLRAGRLKKLRDDGLLTQAEFMAQISK